MQALRLYAGPKARQHIEQHGLRPQDVGTVPAAAGGPKGLILGPLDRFIFGHWLTQSAQPVHLVGASIGAWRMATACLQGTASALERLERDYIAQHIALPSGQKRATAAQISRQFRSNLQAFFGGRVGEVLRHPRYQLHVVASREMKRNAMPMDKYIAVNWFNEVDIANIGADAAKGIKRGTNVVGGQEHPLIQQILKDLYDKGKGNGDRKHTNDIFYNTGLATYAPVFEGARLAIKQYGWPLTSDKMKRGLESLRNFDANGLIAPVTVTAKDHGGGGKTRIDMWDGAKWVPETGWFSAYDDVVQESAKKESAEFAKSKQ